MRYSLSWLTERFARLRAQGEPPTLPDPPLPAFYLDSANDVTEIRKRLDRAAIDGLKREILAMIHDEGTLRVTGGCCNSLRAIAELIHEDLVQEGKDADGHLILIATRAGMVAR